MAFQQGARVEGHYYGVPLTGTVESSRPHTMRNEVQIVFVNLDAQITVYGLERDRVAMDVHCVTGLPVPGFGPCHLRAA